MKTSLKLNLIIFIGGIIAIIAVTAPFFIHPSNNESVNWSRSQVTLSAIGFIAIFYAFYSTTIQLRKSMAKPELELFFNEEGGKEYKIELGKVKRSETIKLFLYNKGNLVAKTYQINVRMPRIYNPRFSDPIGLPHEYFPAIKSVGSGDKCEVSFINHGKMMCFVEQLLEIPYLMLDINPQQYGKYNNTEEITYKIYSDYGNPSEGILKLNLIKQQEVT